MTRRGVFITGTGTGVGKTLVSASLAVALAKRGVRCRMIKPFATGINDDVAWQDNDPLFLQGVMDSIGGVFTVGQCWKLPLSPYDAALIEGVACDFSGTIERLIAGSDTQVFDIWEGAGGVLVPLAEELTVRDAINRVGLPVLVVAQAGLGSINQTLLTLEALRGLDVLGVIFNEVEDSGGGIAGKVSPKAVAKFGGVKVFGTVPFEGCYRAASTAEVAVTALPWDCEAIQDVADCLV